MKKSLFLIPALALALASCSNDDPIAGSETGSEGNFETNYLSVNLVQAPDIATRADYEDGDASENKVTNVRFYFFDEEGNASNVKKVGDKFQNFYDWESGIISEDGDSENVEKKLNAVLIINTKDGDKLPAKVVALLNPNNLSLGNNNLDLDKLQKVLDYANHANASSDNKVFIMSNSVYTKDDENPIIATDIPTSNYSNSPEGAKANPVNIYVERCVAKVRVTLNSGLTTTTDKDGNTLIKLTKKEGTVYNDIVVDHKQVYLKLGKWNLTAETNQGNLIKEIKPTDWTGPTSEVFSTWNKSEYFRSFWAVNAEGVQQNWHNYNEIASLNGKGYYSDNDKLANSLYTNENAPQQVLADNNIGAFTKVILSGELGTLSDENEFIPVTITKFAGITAIGEDALISTLLESMGTNMIYTKTSDGKYVSLQYSTEPGGEKDVKLVTAITAGQATKGEDNKGRYYVYLALSEKGENKTWSKNNTTEGFETGKFDGKDAVNNYLASTPGKAQVYNEGKTYYYFPIKHLGTASQIGGYGVVRNHIYDCTINEITGLGTPVYKPDETIYPEKPEDDDTFIAAQINILSWRLVTQDVNLNW